jgi:cyanophycin synthetase
MAVSTEDPQVATQAVTQSRARPVFEDVRALRQHNRYAYMPVLHAKIELGPYAEASSDTFPGFVDRLRAWLPGIDQHECSLKRPGGFVERLRRGTYLPHIAEHVCLELQNRMGFPVAFGRARGTGVPGRYQVLVEYKEEEPARAALDTALELTLAAMHDEPFDVPGEIERLLGIADEYRLGPSTAAIVQAARRWGIPVIRLQPKGSLVQLGYGTYQKRILASETSGTSAIAVDLCQEKPLTNRMLRAVGVPVPEGRTADSADEAAEAATSIGFPVVVKPHAGNQGKGVTVGLMTEADVRDAYDVAASFDSRVLVEQQIEGQDFRLLVVAGKMIAAARRDPPQVVGDGVLTVEALVAQVNADPLRRPGHSNPLTQIRLDDAALLVLRMQGLDLESIPARDQVVRLRRNGNLSTGGTAEDVTDQVHPKNARVAELAAQILNLDVAGIDVLCHDIARPLPDQGGAIVEVNAAPGLRMHLHPTRGIARPVGKDIVRMLYPEGEATRIPIVAITGTNGKTTVTRLVAHIYRAARWKVGMTNTDGIYIDDERIVSGDSSGPRSAQAVLLHPQVDVAVLETARGGILREGLGYDGCDIGVVTNVAADHLGIGGIDTIEELARVKQVVIDAVRDEGTAVLNADDPHVAAMAADTKAKIVYFGMDPNGPVIAAHVAEGGRAVTVEDGAIVMRSGPVSVDLVELERVPFTAGGRIRFQVANALAAAAVGWAAGHNPAIVARALTTFRTDSITVPGRFNVLEIQGVQIVLDYGHNRAAMEALGQALDALGHRRTVMVLGLPGDRRNEDLLETFRATFEFADAYVIHDLADLRERAPGEVPELLRTVCPPSAPLEVAADQREAIQRAWAHVGPGERLLVIADTVDSALEYLQSLPKDGTTAIDEDRCEDPMVPSPGSRAWTPGPRPH